MVLAIKICVILSLVIVAALIINYIEKNQRIKNTAMNFRESMELLEFPVVTFQVGDKKLHFLLDTGSNMSIINKKLLEHIPTKEVKGSSKLFGLEGKERECSYVNIDLVYRDRTYSDKFQVVDMTSPFKSIKSQFGVTLHGIIGSCFMDKYKYVIDFNEMIVYSKK